MSDLEQHKPDDVNGQFLSVPNVGRVTNNEPVDLVTANDVWPKRWECVEDTGLARATDRACNFLEDALSIELGRATRMAVAVALEDEPLPVDAVVEAARLLCKDVKLLRDVQIGTLAAAHLLTAYKRYGPPMPGKVYTENEMQEYKARFEDVAFHKARAGYVLRETQDANNS